MRLEDQLAQQVATYLNLQYPSVIYHFDTGSGGRTTIGMAMRNKKLNKWRGWADLFIAHPMNGWHGLFIELKVTSPFKKDGMLKKDEHLEEQMERLNDLQYRGYYSTFGVGFEHTKKMIDWYLTPNGVFKYNKPTK